MSERATSARALRPRDARSLARPVALAALSALSADGRDPSRWPTEPRVHFVQLHHVFPDEEARFEAMLGELGKTHEFIGYSDAVQRVVSGDIDRAYMCFSFDDGLKNCVRAATLLEQHGASACFFVCPGIVGESDPELIDRFCRDQLDLPPVELMDWTDVDGLVARGHEIGGHTVTHPDLSQLSRDQVAEEIGGSFELLQSRLGEVQHFSWPFGVLPAFSPEAAACVFESGYGSCASSLRGCHVSGAPVPESLPFLRRENVSASWPLGHTRYLLARSARQRQVAGAAWPPGWREGHAAAAGGA